MPPGEPTQLSLFDQVVLPTATEDVAGERCAMCDGPLIGSNRHYHPIRPNGGADYRLEILVCCVCVVLKRLGHCRIAESQAAEQPSAPH